MKRRGREVKQRKKVFEFICKFKADNDGLSPTYQEIADHFKWTSLNNAWTHVDKLVNEDRLVWLDDNRRMRIDGHYDPPVNPRSRDDFSEL